MIEIDFSLLQRIGWKPAMRPALVAELQAEAPDALATKASAPPRLMRLTEVHRETLTVHDGHGERPARVLPRLARQLLAEGTAVAVGDWLLCREHVDTATAALWACARLAPANHIARRDADGRRHPVVSNVDTAFFVMGLDADFNPRRLERYLLLARDDVRSVVVLTKADLVAPDPAARAAMVADEMDALRERIGPRVALLAVDGTAPTAALQLAPWLETGQTVVLLGSSGAGKSTLTNTLTARSSQDTGPVRTQDHRGRHTTTSRSLHALPGGACVIDTPGLRALRPDIDEDTLAAGFEDIERLATRCRFRDCAHGVEPGCAVRAGVPPDRLRNYQKLRRELARDVRRASAR